MTRPMKHCDLPTSRHAALRAKTRHPHVPAPVRPAAVEGEGGATRRRVYGWAVLITLGGFLFGYDTGVVSGALLFIRDTYGLSPFEQGCLVSVLLVGAMIGALAAGRTADRLGRRKTLALEGVVFMVGAVVVSLAPSYECLLAGRVVLGLAVGGVSATAPVYLGEIAPAEVRGRVLALQQVMVTIGILCAYLVDLAFASSGQWRWMFAVGMIPASALVLGTRFLPESPAWRAHSTGYGHLLRHRTDRRNQPGATAGPAPVPLAGAGCAPRSGWKYLLAPQARAALIVGLVLAASQQFGGINTVIYYAPTVLAHTGASVAQAVLCSVCIGAVNVAATLVALHFIERTGRRRLLMISLSAMFVTLMLLGASFLLHTSSTLSLLLMVLYIMAYAPGMGPVFWVLIGEIFPPSARAAGSSASTAVNWGANFFVSLAFLPLARLIGLGPAFWCYAAVCLFAVWFSWRYVPETRNRDFAQIDRSLQSRFASRRGGPRTA